MEGFVKFVLGVIALAIILIVGFFSSLYGAFVFSEIYSWFLQPIFGYELGVLFFYGLLVFIGLFKYRHPKVEDKDGKTKPFAEQFGEALGQIITLAIYYSLVWGMGYLAFVLIS